MSRSSNGVSKKSPKHGQICNILHMKHTFYGFQGSFSTFLMNNLIIVLGGEGTLIDGLVGDPVILIG